MTKKKRKAGSETLIPLFLEKTYTMVADKETDDTISWNKAGDGFLVLRQHVCAEKILPRYFRHSNFSSFVRQLNFYGFKKCFHEVAACEFKHPDFLRDKKHLLTKIKRKSSESSANQKQVIEKLQKDFDDLKERNENLWRFQRKMMYAMSSFIRSNQHGGGMSREMGEFFNDFEDVGRTKRRRTEPPMPQRPIHTTNPMPRQLDALDLCEKIEHLADGMPDTPQAPVSEENWWEQPKQKRQFDFRSVPQEANGFGPIPVQLNNMMAVQEANGRALRSSSSSSSSRARHVLQNQHFGFDTKQTSFGQPPQHSTQQRSSSSSMYEQRSIQSDRYIKHQTRHSPKQHHSYAHSDHSTSPLSSGFLHSPTSFSSSMGYSQTPSELSKYQKLMSVPLTDKSHMDFLRSGNSSDSEHDSELSSQTRGDNTKLKREKFDPPAKPPGAEIGSPSFDEFVSASRHPFMESAGSLAENLGTFPQSEFYSQPDSLPGSIRDPQLVLRMFDESAGNQSLH